MQEEYRRLLPPPEQSKLQPLFRKEGEAEAELRPFFSTRGETPWGEIVSPAAEGPPPPRISRIEDGAPISISNDHPVNSRQAPLSALVMANDLDTAFLTDAEVTVRSQLVKRSGQGEDHHSFDKEIIMTPLGKRQAARSRHTEQMQAIQQWVLCLQEVSDSHPISGDFRFDVDAIMAFVFDALKK